MKPICYKNTKTNLPGWVNTVHIEQKYGYAYETDTHFVHFYGKEPYYIISSGLTVTEKKNGTLNEWVSNRFGAIDIQSMTMDVGHSVDGIWRPSLYFWDDTCEAIKISSSEQISEENSLRALIQQLDTILFYVEPSIEGLESYSHKIRELLILSCTEIENQWRSLIDKSNVQPMNGRMFTTQDYVKLKSKTHIDEFVMSLRNLSYSSQVKPFENWNDSAPTQSLAWYYAYNETKHNREANFHCAKLKYVIDSIVANIIFYAIRFNPISIINNNNIFGSTVNQMFNINIVNADRTSFYIPLLDTAKIQNPDCIVIDSYRENLKKDWIVENLTL